MTKSAWKVERSAVVQSESLNSEDSQKYWDGECAAPLAGGRPDPAGVSDLQLGVLSRQAQWLLDEAAYDFPAARVTVRRRQELAASLEALAVLVRASTPATETRSGERGGGPLPLESGQAHPSSRSAGTKSKASRGLASRTIVYRDTRHPATARPQKLKVDLRRGEVFDTEQATAMVAARVGVPLRNVHVIQVSQD